MKQLVVGIVGVGAVIALRSAAGRSGHKMSEHCKQMMASQPGEHGKASGMHEHCKEMTASHEGHDQAAETREHSEQEAPRVVASGGEAVAV